MDNSNHWVWYGFNFVVPVLFFYSNLISSDVYRNKIGCFHNELCCQIFRSAIGFRFCVLTVLIGVITCFRFIIIENPGPAAYDVTLPAYMLYFAVLFFAMCWPVFSIIRRKLNNPSDRWLVKTLVWVLNVLGSGLIIAGIAALTEIVFVGKK